MPLRGLYFDVLIFKKGLEPPTPFPSHCATWCGRWRLLGECVRALACEISGPAGGGGGGAHEVRKRKSACPPDPPPAFAFICRYFGAVFVEVEGNFTESFDGTESAHGGTQSNGRSLADSQAPAGPTPWKPWPKRGRCPAPPPSRSRTRSGSSSRSRSRSRSPGHTHRVPASDRTLNWKAESRVQSRRSPARRSPARRTPGPASVAVPPEREPVGRLPYRPPYPL